MLGFCQRTLLNGHLCVIDAALNIVFQLKVLICAILAERSCETACDTIFIYTYMATVGVWAPGVCLRKLLLYYFVHLLLLLLLLRMDLMFVHTAVLPSTSYTLLLC